MPRGTRAGRRGPSLGLIGTTLAILGGLVACGDDSSGGLTPGQDQDLDTATTQPSAEARSLTGSWEGTYDCDGSSIGLTLTIDDRGGGEVAANFAYHPTDASAAGPAGRYSMEGTVTAGQLALGGGEWIEQGGDRAMVRLEAAAGDRPGPEHLEGTVVGEGCSTFSVDRVSTDPWYVGTFQGEYGCDQGMTGLTLTVEDATTVTGVEAAGRAVDATYEFYAVPENPGVPSGSYRMEGTYNQGEMVLHGAEWIDRPEGYLMVDLRIASDLGIDPQRLYGIVGLSGGGDSNCSLFTLDRVEA